MDEQLLHHHSFVLQDVCRFILLVLSILACRALCQGRDGIGYLRALFRGLLVLIVLEAVELCFNAQAVHSVCDAPEVWAARERRGRNNTMDEERCELISNIYDFAYGGLAILLLMYISYVVHSYVRELRKKVPAEVATASIGDVQMSVEGGDGGARRGAGGVNHVRYSYSVSNVRCVGLHHVYNVSEPHFNRGSLRRSLRAFARSTRWRQSRSDTSTPKKTSPMP